MLNLKEDISAKDVVDAIIRTNTPSTIVSEIKRQFKYNPFVFYIFPSIREVKFQMERHASLEHCYGIGLLHVRETSGNKTYAAFLLDVDNTLFVEGHRLVTYRSFVYINRIIFDYNNLKKEKEGVPTIEETKFYFKVKVDGENLLMNK